jgi:23S rRNA pseudouridine1911/1915/1917 synthase
MMSEPTNAAASRRVSCVVTDEDADERADVVLGRRIPALSRRLARALARDGKLRVDGRRQPPSIRVRVGQRLELDLAQDHEAPALDQLDVLASTDDFIYVHKPAGVHTVALTPAQPGVLATAVAARFPDCAQASEDPREAGAVHRLDRPTSGVVAFARSREAWSRARAGFSEERVAKHYLAVCTPIALEQPQPWPPPLPTDGLQGWLASAEPASDFDPSQLASVIGDMARHDRSPGVRIRAAIGPDGPKRSAVRLDGRRASTVVYPLVQHASHWLVRLLLETGRRHQARVHLAWVDLPILGDPLYGPLADPLAPNVPEAGAAIHLHAFVLDLRDMFPGERAVFAPPPPGFWPPTKS